MSCSCCLLLHAGRFISDLNDNEKRPTSGGRRAFRELEFGVFLGSVEAGALFTDAGEVAMTEDGGIGVVFLQTAE